MTQVIEPTRTLIDCPEPGIYRNVPAADYHRWDAVSQSFINKCRETSPAHARYEQFNPADPTPSKMVGTALHTLVLEPDEFERTYKIAEQCVETTGKGKQCSRGGSYLLGGQWFCAQHAKASSEILIAERDRVASQLVAQGCELYDESDRSDSVYYRHAQTGKMYRISDHEPNAKTAGWIARNQVTDIRITANLTDDHKPINVLTESQLDALENMADSIRGDSEASLLLDSATGEHRELSIVHRCPETGVLCKERIDLDCGLLIADLKTTQSAHPRDFEKSIFNYGYHIQSDQYMCGAHAVGLDPEGFQFIAIEKKPPYACKVYRIEEELIEKAHELRIGWLERIKQYQESNNWPAYGAGVSYIGVPSWGMKKIEEELEELEKSE